MAAAGAVRGGDAPALADLGTILFYLPRNVSPAELGLIEALAERRPCYVVLGTTGDDSGGRAGGGAGELGRGCNDGGTGDGGIGWDSTRGGRQGEVRLHVAPTAHEEVRRAIRRIAQEAREEGTPFHRMAILYRMDNPYASLVRDELRLADMPVAGPDRRTLADSAAGRTLTGLLDMPRRRVPAGGRDGVADELSGTPARRVGRRGFSPSRWDSLTRAAGVVRGPEQWRERLRSSTRCGLAEEASRRLDGGGNHGGARRADGGGGGDG